MHEHAHGASRVSPEADTLLARRLPLCSFRPGTACAWSLSRFPDQFDVHVWEALAVPGGVASSCKVKDGEELHDMSLCGIGSFFTRRPATLLATKTGISVSRPGMDFVHHITSHAPTVADSMSSLITPFVLPPQAPTSSTTRCRVELLATATTCCSWRGLASSRPPS